MVVSADALMAFSVLIVEDNLSARNIICKTMSLLFPLAIIYSACNGKTGLELFKKHTTDIVITDISMPLMNGLEMVAEIKHITTKTMFIVFTGHSEGDYLSEFKKIGVNNYLLKPLNMSELICTVKECINCKISNNTSIV